MFAVVAIFGFKLPSDVGKHALGYGYTLDEAGYCGHLAKRNHCDRPSITNKETCKAALVTPDICISAVDTWLGDLNSTCKTQINSMHVCLDKATSEEEEQTLCVAEAGKLLSCAETLQREEWMLMPDVRKGARRKFVQRSSTPKA